MLFSSTRTHKKKKKNRNQKLVLNFFFFFEYLTLSVIGNKIRKHKLLFLSSFYLDFDQVPKISYLKRLVQQESTHPQPLLCGFFFFLPSRCLYSILTIRSLHESQCYYRKAIVLARFVCFCSWHTSNFGRHSKTSTDRYSSSPVFISRERSAVYSFFLMKRMPFYLEPF